MVMQVTTEIVDQLAALVILLLTLPAVSITALAGLAVLAPALEHLEV